MSKVSTTRRAIVLAEKKILNFWAEDVHKVFGIPCGHRNIKGRDSHINPGAIPFIKSIPGMDKTVCTACAQPKNSFRGIYLNPPAKLEKDCFQIDSVIFVIPPSIHMKRSISGER
ncbi:hypothetical protein ACQJBY_058490 [Aegilops geniculata]